MDGLGMSWMDETAHRPDPVAEGPQLPETLEGLREYTLSLHKTSEGSTLELAELRKELAARTVQFKQELAKATALAQRCKQAEQQLARTSGEARAEAETRAKLDEATGVIEALEGRVTEAEGQRGDLKEQLDVRNRRLQALEADVDSADKSAQDEHARRVAMEHTADRELEALAAELRSLRDRSKQQLGDKDAKIEQLLGRLDGAQARATECEASSAERLQAELEIAHESAAARIVALEEQVRDYKEALEGNRSNTQTGRLLEELASSQTEKVQLQAELASLRKLTESSLRQKSNEVSRLVQESTALRTELTAAKLAAQHSHQHAQQVFSIWSLPYVLARSLSLRGLSLPVFESSSELNAQIARLQQLTHGCLPIIIIFAVVLCLGLFLMVPRYVL